MAGTDKSARAVTGGPAVILVRPQLGENIGAAARAMLNFGLTDLRLVAPRDGWPNDTARAMASGADAVIDGARVFSTLEEAAADLIWLTATTARNRDLAKDVLVPAEAASAARAHLAGGEGIGFVFGPERAGLTNDEVSLADRLVTIPANPAFASLNLAQAVLILGFAWFTSMEAPLPARRGRVSRPATKAELFGLFEHLETELDRAGFLFPPAKAPAMVRTIRGFLSRANFTEQDVRTLRGMVKALVYPKPSSRFRRRGPARAPLSSDEPV